MGEGGGGGGENDKVLSSFPVPSLEQDLLKTTAEAFDRSPVQVGASVMVIKVLVH